MGLVLLSVLVLVLYFLHLKEVIHIPFFPSKDDPDNRL